MGKKKAPPIPTNSKPIYKEPTTRQKLSKKGQELSKQTSDLRGDRMRGTTSSIENDNFVPLPSSSRDIEMRDLSNVRRQQPRRTSNLSCFNHSEESLRTEQEGDTSTETMTAGNVSNRTNDEFDETIGIGTTNLEFIRKVSILDLKPCCLEINENNESPLSCAFICMTIFWAHLKCAIIFFYGTIEYTMRMLEIDRKRRMIHL